jgi:hypothetical protein
VLDVRPQDIVDLQAIADRAGVTFLTVVDRWWPQPDFPRPMKVFLEGPIWYWPAVQAWIERTDEVHRWLGNEGQELA